MQAAPLIVEVVDVTVTVPAPMFLSTTNQPAGNEPPACGCVTAIADAFESVTSFPLSPATTMYVVPVCALTVSGMSPAAPVTDPLRVLNDVRPAPPAPQDVPAVLSL